MSLSFADEPKATCTCPAHRRNKFCKHVVALCVALLECPAEFARAEPPPTAPREPRAKKGPSKERRARPAADETVARSRGAGLETMAGLLDALAADGLVGVGPEKLALLASLGELVRARKLRRLGNGILKLRRVVEGSEDPTPNVKGAEETDPTAVARLLSDLALTYRTTLAHLEGRIALDPVEAEDLLGKTWRETDLEPVADLELVELAAETASEGEFRIQTGYFVELASGELFLERQITPVRLSGAPRPRQRCRLIVAEARLYPGRSPRRIRLGRFQRAPLTLDDVARIVVAAPDDFSTLRGWLIERLEHPFASPSVPVLFRPAAVVASAGRLGALDRQGRFLGLEWPHGGVDDLAKLLPSASPVALLGDLGLAEDGLCLYCRALVGTHYWERGPIYPDGASKR